MKKWQKWKWFDIHALVEVWSFIYESKSAVKDLLSKTLENEESHVARDILNIL